MDLKSAFARATRAMREEAGLHLVAISSLTIAFLCLATSLLAITNLGALADSWGRTARLSVYLRDGAEAQDVEELRIALEGLPEVRAIEHLTSSAAREQFLRDAEIGADLSALPADAFPASLEIELAAGVTGARVDAITDRVRRFGSVEDVETYRGWFARVESLVVAGRGVASGLALLVVLCVVFVVGNTIRLAVAGRRDEIEVMKLCGATNGFVRGPFIVEGAVQGSVSALVALLILLVAYVALRGHVDGTLASIVGTQSVFLHPGVALALVLGGALLGATGSVLSLRRYLAV
ncbi:cell division protein FtsX [Sandaracinus amylolyticus]|uniref:Cell division protein FtsX n=1 Tax=Sandaracinus amylolyticus TaxID=927083 RepID=A0A0F6W569_9BACT|nr:permease-like cell division protein FtsX [Sandaracinus amylolyticus]AKF07775.1 Cell division protein FtsX [Sandaracinus amylolyticus]